MCWDAEMTGWLPGLANQPSAIGRPGRMALTAADTLKHTLLQRPLGT